VHGFPGEPHPEQISPAGEMCLVGWVPCRLDAQPSLLRIALEGPRTIMVQDKVVVGMHGSRLSVHVLDTCCVA
jgi:hypothetical protein